MILCAGGFLLLLPAIYAQSSLPLHAGSLSRHPLSVITLAERPTSILSFRSLSVGIAGEKRFLVSGYGEYSLAMALPDRKNGFGFSVFYGGSPFLHRTNVGLAYARQVGEKMGLAVQFNYRALSIAGDYANTSAVFTRMGLSFQLTPQLRTSIHISDPLGMASQRKKENRLESGYSAGIGYEISEKCYAGFFIQKQESREAMMIADIIYSPVSYLRIHGGVNAENGASWLGLSWRRKNFQFGLSISIHQQLGYWPISTVGFESVKSPMP